MGLDRLGENPLTHPLGWHWGTLTHELLVVDWEGSDGRYLVDGGKQKVSSSCATILMLTRFAQPGAPGTRPVREC